MTVQTANCTLSGSARSSKRPSVTGEGCLDAVERTLVVLLYCGLFVRILSAFDAHEFLTTLPLASEGLVVVFMLLRRSSRCVSRKPGEWLLAISATCSPFLVAPHPGQFLISPTICAAVWLAGMVIQCHAKLVLGRSFGLVPANRGLKSAGPYNVVRHPMYAGYLLTHVAYLVMNPSPWNLGVYLAGYSLQVPRLFAEERLLEEDPAYREYKAAVPYRLVPGVF